MLNTSDISFKTKLIKKPKMNLSLLTVTAVFGLFLTTTMLVFTFN